MSLKPSNTILPASLLDTDLYKLTMQQAVLQHFADVQATYHFTHRDKNVYFTRECFEHFKLSVTHFGELRLTDAEKEWLKAACPYFTSEYLQYLSEYQFKPDQVHVEFVSRPDDDKWGRLEIDAIGPWAETILWEVPLMACLSEIYFRTVDTDWNYDGQEENAYHKGETLLKAGCVFSEFGTRRRRSFHTHDLVMHGLVRASKDYPDQGRLTGTSNVHLARLHNVAPVGTIAHEWYMAIGALEGYAHANDIALRLWEAVYPDQLHIALTDTFSTEAFYKDFVRNPDIARKWTGLRQDSGDPFVYAPRAKQIYEQLGIDYREKTIVFSDALNVEKVLKLKKQCDAVGFKASFGIGTSFSNDFKSLSSGGAKVSKALNMVIKLASANGKPCVKISDELTKNTGDPETVQLVKTIFGL
ncbi:nicotinate phosphoribosyltransferase [Laetiporus sulphureus 93-53]|uniref:Nicotinate phosphoribosyltransferase n=1 Tax=Laetiporus sulphureus 93-53 TaxID=1314785 RepID=A0A165CJ60_9APHY|nr:nicotinate phosphoribosyltransferase [Laetiporus sulphureus 93-53]KZT02905.1 nicotinate phosphoribosyltransferase [Laetiporus sulphureus 93-53]